jgi:hypothetical protein
MPNDLLRQIAACQSRIAGVRALIGAVQAAGEATAEAVQQLAREVAFLRTLEDILSEQDLSDDAETVPTLHAKPLQ